MLLIYTQKASDGAYPVLRVTPFIAWFIDGASIHFASEDVP